MMSSSDAHKGNGQIEDKAGTDLAAKLRLLPSAPGVYLYKDRQGKILYVGKARQLRARVRSYFQETEDRPPRTAQLVKKIADLDYIATDSETDALVLENQLIKEYRPRYNVRLKDDKQYPYLRISLQEPYPRLSVVRRMGQDGARYFGPYTDVRAMRETMKFAAGLFQVRTCSLDLPDPAVKRPCLDYQIGRCTAPCVELADKHDYAQQVRHLVAFLEGRNKQVIAELRAAMQRHAERLKFEAAAHLRDRIARLETAVAQGRTLDGIVADADVCGLVRDGADACGVVLRVRQGRILTTHHFLLHDPMQQDHAAFLGQMLREYYPLAADIPVRLLLSHDLPDLAVWNAWLTRLHGSAVRLHVPERGRRREAVELALRNAAYRLSERHLRDAAARDRRVDPGDVALQEALGLSRIPATIECFDISNYQGHETVGSLVYFKEGQPLKSRYRRFRIRGVEGPNDLASMEEVLDRYYGKLAQEDKRPADLVLVDGGIGQLGRARAVLARHGFGDTDLIGLAKREEIIVREEGELRLSRRSPALRLLQRVRDEAHRFAITYHRLLRDQRMSASALDGIPGIGQVKKLSLLHRFGSVQEVRRASIADLESVRGLSAPDIARLMAFFDMNPEDPAEHE